MTRLYEIDNTALFKQLEKVEFLKSSGLNTVKYHLIHDENMVDYVKREILPFNKRMTLDVYQRTSDLVKVYNFPNWSSVDLTSLIDRYHKYYYLILSEYINPMDCAYSVKVRTPKDMDSLERYFTYRKGTSIVNELDNSSNRVTIFQDNNKTENQIVKNGYYVDLDFMSSEHFEVIKNMAFKFPYPDFDIRCGVYKNRVGLDSQNVIFFDYFKCDGS